MPQPDVQKSELVSSSRVAALSSQTPVALSNGSSVGETSAPTLPAPASLVLSESKTEIPVTMGHCEL